MSKTSNNIKEDLKTFERLAESLLNAEDKTPVIEPLSAKEITEKLDIGLNENPCENDELEAALKGIMLSTPRTATKMFFNQLFGGRQSKATLGELTAVMLNNSMYTFKVGGPQILVEQEIIHKMIDLIGYDENGGGTIAPGGSMTNLMAMIMGRDKFNRDIRKNGVSSKMTMYTSKESHYSIPKNASFIGIGRYQVRYVMTNERGEMDPDALEKAILEDQSKGNQPFMIIATAGTTVMGAFDPIEAISNIARKHDLWLHVDGAYCGSVIFSQRHRKLLDGLSEADSFSVNAHKMLGVPLSCSLVFAKDKKNLYASFSNNADYLYQTDNDDLNPGKISLQCGRRNDALKFWTLWKSIGTQGLGQAVDHQFHLAKVARDYVRNHPDYTLYNFEDTIAVCFNYKGIPADEICTKLYEQGEIMVGFGRFEDEVFVRLITVNFSLSEEELMKFFEKFEAFAEEKILSSAEV